MPRFAALDIGSNAMRLRIVEVDVRADVATSGARRAVRELLSLRAPVRLGREVFLTGTLTAAAISRATEALRDFRERMDAFGVESYRAVATSAVREAKNGHLLVERAEREAGVRIDVIEGIEEARLVQLAVRRKLGLAGHRAVLIDIGGGSTELTLLADGQPRAAQSLPMGTVRLLEAFLDSGARVTSRQARLVDEYLERVLGELAPEIARSAPEQLVATGGNVDALAALCPAGIDDAPALDFSACRTLVARLASMPPAERASVFNLRADRADTIVPAAYILLRVANVFGHTTAAAPGVGLKEGILDELLEQYFAPALPNAEDEAITRACVQLGRHYHFDEAHGVRVARFATQIFDDLAPRHALGPRERTLLMAAAILHDVGDFVRNEGHHKHSLYIIEHSDLMGLSPGERSVVANVARYHRKSHPDTTHENFRELSHDARARVRSLASMLRLADALDREHLGKIANVRAVVHSATLRLVVEGDADRELEEWTVARKAGLFRAVFDLDVEVVDASGRAPPASAPRSAP